MKKVYISIIIFLLLIIIGLFIGNINLNNKINEYAKELINLYNENDYIWEQCK